MKRFLTAVIMILATGLVSKSHAHCWLAEKKYEVVVATYAFRVAESSNGVESSVSDGRFCRAILELEKSSTSDEIRMGTTLQLTSSRGKISYLNSPRQVLAPNIISNYVGMYEDWSGPFGATRSCEIRCFFIQNESGTNRDSR